MQTFLPQEGSSMSLCEHLSTLCACLFVLLRASQPSSAVSKALTAHLWLADFPGLQLFDQDLQLAVVVSSLLLRLGGLPEYGGRSDSGLRGKLQCVRCPQGAPGTPACFTLDCSNATDNFQLCCQRCCDSSARPSLRLAATRRWALVVLDRRVHVLQECIGPLCYDFSRLDEYLAQPSVRAALGVGDRAWESCSPDVYQDMSSAAVIAHAGTLPTLLPCQALMQCTPLQVTS